MSLGYQVAIISSKHLSNQIWSQKDIQVLHSYSSPFLDAYLRIHSHLTLNTSHFITRHIRLSPPLTPYARSSYRHLPHTTPTSNWKTLDTGRLPYNRHTADFFCHCCREPNLSRLRGINSQVAAAIGHLIPVSPELG